MIRNINNVLVSIKIIDTHTKLTPNLHQTYTKLTLKLHQSYTKLTLNLHQTYTCKIKLTLNLHLHCNFYMSRYKSYTKVTM